MKFIPYAECKTPVSKARYWKREMAYQAEILDGLGRDQSPARDVASDAYWDANVARRSILVHERQLRTRERA